MGILTGGWNPFRTPLREIVGGITGNQYLAGKEGYLPDIKMPQLKIKGTPVSEVFSKEGYQAGGEWWRKAGTSRFKGFTTGLFGIGAMEYAEGKEGLLPDWGRPGQFPKVVDTSGDGKGLVNIELPEIVIPELPKIPEFPKIPDLSGVIPEINIPEFPEINIPVNIPEIGGGFQLTNDEGEPNLLLMGGLAYIAYKVLTGRKK